MIDQTFPQGHYISVSVDDVSASVQFYQKHVSCLVLYHDATRALLLHGNTKFELVKAPSSEQLAAEVTLEHLAATQASLPLEAQADQSVCRGRGTMVWN